MKPGVFPPISRRALIFGGGLALVSIPFACTLVLFGKSYPKRSVKLRYVSEGEARIIECLGVLTLPDSTSNPSPFGLSVADANLPQGIDELLDSASRIEREQAHILLWVVEFAFPWTIGRFGRFTELSENQQSRILEKMDEARWDVSRLLVRGVKTLVNFPYFNHPIVQKKLYDGWCDT